MEPKFVLNQNVNRIEKRDNRKAQIIEIQSPLSERDYAFYLLSYDEGGTGWWPESAIEALEE